VLLIEVGIRGISLRFDSQSNDQKYHLGFNINVSVLLTETVCYRHAVLPAVPTMKAWSGAWFSAWFDFATLSLK
jgi:hypothetical protein